MRKREEDRKVAREKERLERERRRRDLLVAEKKDEKQRQQLKKPRPRLRYSRTSSTKQLSKQGIVVVKESAKPAPSNNDMSLRRPHIHLIIELSLHLAKQAIQLPRGAVALVYILGAPTIDKLNTSAFT